MPQADEWNRVKKVLDQEREALSTWGYDCSHSSNVWSAFHLVGEPDPPEKNPDRCNARTYFRKVCALPELFVLSAFAAQRSLIKTFKREPDFVADEALKWYAEVVHPPILSGFSDGFFAGAPAIIVHRLFPEVEIKSLVRLHRSELIALLLFKKSLGLPCKESEESEESSACPKTATNSEANKIVRRLFPVHEIKSLLPLPQAELSALLTREDGLGLPSPRTPVKSQTELRSPGVANETPNLEASPSILKIEEYNRRKLATIPQLKDFVAWGPPKRKRQESQAYPRQTTREPYKSIYITLDRNVQDPNDSPSSKFPEYPPISRSGQLLPPPHSCGHSSILGQQRKRQSISWVLNRSSPRFTLIEIDKQYLLELMDKPSNITGQIWFGSLPGLCPFISIKVTKELSSPVRQRGKIFSPKHYPSRKIKSVYLITPSVFCELVKGDGFGKILWNEVENAGFLTIEVLDTELRKEFIRVGKEVETLEYGSP